MDAIIAFIVAAGISFWGSLQLGLVNVAVVETTLTKGTRHALMLAIGGVLPEIPYTLLAIYATDYVRILEKHQSALAYGIGAVFISLGVYYFLKKVKTPTLHDGDGHFRKRGSFLKGFGLASLNPQLIFFWSGILIALKSESLSIYEGEQLIDFEANGVISPKWTFAIGAAIGALAILVIYIFLARKYKHKISDKLNARLNKIVGAFFILLGLYSIINNVI